jgi:hypothetical protein
VDAELGHAVEPGAELGEPPRHPALRDGRVEVRDLRADAGGDLVAAGVRVRPLDADPQVALVAPAGRDEDPLLDPPGDGSAVALGVVLGRAEREQPQRPAQQHDLAALRRVQNADQAEGEAAEENPVGACEPLEVLDAPDLVELGARQRHVGHLLGRHAAVLGGGLLGGLDYLDPAERAAAALEKASWVAWPHV